MVTKRAPGQRLINLAAKETFIKCLDDLLVEKELGERSQFIRDAMREKINRELGNNVVSREMTLPPGKMGKGGRRPVKYPPTDGKSYSLNDASSKADAAATKALGKVGASVRRPPAK